MSLLTYAAKTVLCRSGALALPRRFARENGTAVILRYHSVSTGADYCLPGLAVSPALFDRQMAYLSTHYTVLCLDELVGALTGAAILPPRAVAITFDDGYLDNAQAALPILQKHRLTATFHLTSGAVAGRHAFWVGWLYRALRRCRTDDRARALAVAGRPPPAAVDAGTAFKHLASAVNIQSGPGRWELLETIGRRLGAPSLADPSDFMLRPDDVSTLRKAGMTIGAHTASHPILPSLPPAEALAEMLQCREELEALAGRPVLHLAYPNGPGVPSNFTAKTAKLAGTAGFLSAGTSVRGAAQIGACPFTLPRQGINDTLGFHGFAVKLEEHKLFALLPQRRRTGL